MPSLSPLPGHGLSMEPTGVCLLVDLENIQPSPEEVESWLGDKGEAWIFYGPHQAKRKAVFETHSPRSTLVPISRTGSNSLDFHLVFYLGYLAAKNPQCRFYVLARDKGYKAPIEHARTLAFSVDQLASLSTATPKTKATRVPAGKSPATKSAAKPAAKTNSIISPKAKSPVQTSGKGTAPSMPRSQDQGKAHSQPKPKLQIQIYRNLVEDLGRPNRPGSLPALQRHIRSKFGPEGSPEKVQMLIDRLLTSDVIQLVARKLSYPPP